MTGPEPLAKREHHYQTGYNPLASSANMEFNHIVKLQNNDRQEHFEQESIPAENAMEYLAAESACRL